MGILRIAGSWESLFGLSSIKIIVKQRSWRIFGVATVTSFLSKDQYHFEGAVNGDVVTAVHHSGKRFYGKILSPELIEGVLTLKSGKRLKLSAKRVAS